MVTGRFDMCDEDDWKGQRVVARWPRMGAMTQLGLVRIASRFSLARGGWAVEEENTALTATARGEEGEAHESEVRPTCVFSPKQRKWRTKMPRHFLVGILQETLLQLLVGCLVIFLRVLL
jgi:hypothetical protein